MLFFQTEMSESLLDHSSSSQSTVVNSTGDNASIAMATNITSNGNGNSSVSANGDSSAGTPVQEQPESPSLADSALGGAASPDIVVKSACSSLSDRDEENFESYGENDDVEYDDR